MLRASLVDAAARCFARHGVAATTLADVAAEAGVSPATLYRHVDGRDDLVGAVVEQVAHQLIARLDAIIVAAGSLEELLVETLAEALDALQRDPVLSGLVAGDADGALRGAAASSGGVLLEAVGVARRAAEVRPDLMVQLRRGVEVDEVAEHLVRVALSLLAMPRGDLAETRDYLARLVVPAIVDMSPTAGGRRPERRGASA